MTWLEFDDIGPIFKVTIKNVKISFSAGNCAYINLQLRGQFSFENLILSSWPNNRTEAQWLSGRVLDLRPRGCGLEPHQHHCIVSLGKTH